MGDREIGIEAATLVAVEYATDETEEFKQALATAAQILVDMRTEMLVAEDSGKKRGMELDRIHAALQNIYDANCNFMGAQQTQDLIERRLAR